MGDWRSSLLKAVGAPVTNQNLRFLAGWQRWEGGHTKNGARYNWLNTTHGPGQSINGVGVRAFGNFQTGIRSLAETLMNGRYDDIMGGLQSGNPYAHDLTAGLSTWVSGSPTGGGDYAARVMGTKASRGGGRPAAAAPAAPPPPPSMADFPSDLVDSVWGDMAPLFRGLQKSSAKRGVPADSGMGPMPEYHGKGLMIPTSWKGTHVTDGLGWGTRSAEDIMSDPGRAVLAPSAGRVVYWHPTGAQGGGSMLIRLDNGRQFWLGHIANGVKAGTRFKRGTRLADISSDHPRPHLHVDSR